MVFPVVMYGHESWTVKKAEHRRVDAFEVWCWRRLLRVPRTARRSNQSIWKEISPGISLEGMMLKLKLQYFGTLSLSFCIILNLQVVLQFWECNSELSHKTPLVKGFKGKIQVIGKCTFSILGYRDNMWLRSWDKFIFLSTNYDCVWCSLGV